MKSHFVVLMYGATGCPELRHFGFSHKPMKETKRSDDNLIENGQSSSKVHTNGNNLSHESSSKSEPVAHGVNNMQTMDKKLNDDKMLANDNTTNTQQLIASSSRPMDKENDQRSELLVENTLPDYMFSESPTTVKPLCLGDNDNGHEQDECRRNSLQPVVVESDGGKKNIVVASGGGSDETEINRIPNSVESEGGLKNNVASSGGSDEVGSNRIQKSVEPDGGQKNNVTASGQVDVTETDRMRKSGESEGGKKKNAADKTREWLKTKLEEAEKGKETTVIQNEVEHSNSMHKRSRPADDPTPPAKNVKREPVTSVSRLHNSGYPSTPTGNSTEPMAKWTEPTKEEPTINHGSVGLVKTEPTMNHGFGDMIKKEPKPEPDDYEEALPPGSSNILFSATMSSYQYLELPSHVKLKSKVILLRNGAELWPVLYQAKLGLKALTQTWSIFAKEKGIKPGDVCEFVLESEAKNSLTSSVLDACQKPFQFRLAILDLTTAKRNR
ncbi:hypothetical protein M8C21_024930 [Ambrosia artemisiifolia]|uniref:TF-B3 domain-containing protein n=1 Tax=Ambrosia artemisiifolia TaxID=4212 RepID=A0AAD5GR18_AMBAR|nr:hypothetical protein M8C21_024930 [Ambrosia artemisiifolia]